MLDLINNFISNVNYSEIVTTVVVAAIGALIIKVRPYVKKLLEDITEYTKLQIEASKYEDQFDKAYDIWKLVDENYRIASAITEIYESKADYFNSLLLDQFPSLTQSEIDYIRQVVAGNVNGDKLTSVDSKVIEKN